MNNVLQVKLKFSSEGNTQQPGARNLRSDGETTVEKIESLSDNLKSVLVYYESIDQVVDGILIDVNYSDIIAKSNRIRALIKPKGKELNDVVVGARFSDGESGKENHIITYYVKKADIENGIAELNIVKDYLIKELGGRACKENFNEPECTLNYSDYGIKKTKLRNLIVDCSVIESFSVPHNKDNENRNQLLLTFYKTEDNLGEILNRIGVDSIKYKYNFYGEDTISVTKDLYELIEAKVPYMISMISTDLASITYEDVNRKNKNENRSIVDPKNEPVIGVIDTLFDENTYFSKWVENHDVLDDLERMMLKNNQRNHGTAVTSLIVDGPDLNGWLDDGCGHFRVRHFGVCEEKISTAKLVKKIRNIVNDNPDIHVWNLSIGTEDEVSKNFISYDAAFLDELQSKKNIVFVISGTNDNRSIKKGKLRIGSPADSVNSIVVNSVRRDGIPASYSRKGNVLSFFSKPDISYYGGDYDERIVAYTSQGEDEVYGTSFAAPWISRKLCYLIDVIGLPREVAKALIIDAAAGWEYKKTTYKKKEIVGYGTVPINIEQILSSESDEIKFILYDTALKYKTANYGIPVPRDSDNKYPYIARATLCYFPECSREQGVDYTNRELSVKFGRIDSKGNISDINDNIQDEDGKHVDERKSRREHRKWDNTKFISKVAKKNKALMSYDERQWGVSLISKERLSNKGTYGLNFGLVVTLKEINGINRISDFVSACGLRGWIVHDIKAENRIELYNKNQEEIVFE